MNRSRMRFGMAALVVASAFSAAAAPAQSYGPGEQVLTIGAARFGAEDQEISSWISGADGYLSYREEGLADSPTPIFFRSPVSLPDGARIRRLCMYVRDTAESFDLRVQLRVVKLVYGGQGPAERDGATLWSSLAPGYRSYCQDLDQTVTGIFDVDEDGAPDPAAWYVQVRTENRADFLSIGAVQITWTREVSSPPVTPTFGDVAASHAFYPYIEALAASGVTGGCAGGNYCPDASLTRGQMAVFLAKALGLHWSN